MKKLTKVLSVLLMICTGLNVFAAGNQETSDGIVIGVSLPTQREARWVRDKETMEAYAEELGIDLRMAVADADMAQQASQVENLLAQQVDVLILAPHDASASASLVKRSVAEGVPVISYARLIRDTSDISLFMAIDPEEVGRLQGKFLVDTVGPGNYILMAGAPTDYNATLFFNGAMEYIKPMVDSGEINVVAEQAVENWLPANALAIVENALTAANNKVDAILAPNDGTAGGAIVALEAQGLVGQVVITGQDAEVAAMKRIVAGTQTMSVLKDTRILGKAAIDAAVKIAQGETPDTHGSTIDNGAGEIPALLIPPIVITKDNLDEVVINSGYLDRSQVYGE